MMMSVIGWIVLGLIAGLTASKIVGRRTEGLGGDIALGIVGALIGGMLFHRMGSAGVTGLNMWSLFVAAVGAAVLLVIWHGIRGLFVRA